jgi:F0F1-type ATP synthase assembly protein I
MAKAMSKGSEIIAICLMTVVPAIIGYWLDQRLSTVLLFTVFGFLFGTAGAVLQLARLVSARDPDPASDEKQNNMGDTDKLEG